MNAPTATPADEPLWTVAEVAAYLKLSRSWVYQRAEGGTLPCLRIGAALRFDPNTIRAWARGQLVAVEPARVIALPR